MSSNQRKRCFGLVLVIFTCLISVSTPFQHYASFPTELHLFSGQMKQLDLAMPVTAEITIDDPQIVKVNGQNQPSFRLNLDHPIVLQSDHTGQTEMNLKLFGTIPFKKVKVNVVPDLKVIPGGQTIGVKIKSDGILVVGHHLVQADENSTRSPGEEADVQVGDLIVKVNGDTIKDVKKVAPYVEQAGKHGKPLKLMLKRNGKLIEATLKPVYDQVDKAYRMGLYIRDSAAGVGTLSFYAPDQKVYGALGHVISDMDTGTPISVDRGEVVYSNVTSISKSHNGEPGEKRAHFFNEGEVIGNIQNNTEFGIFGQMQQNPNYAYSNKAIPVAFADEVEEGPAHILTVVNGQKVEKFDIEIVHTAKQMKPATKGMIIKVTDPKLLKQTGGIVQGMSGSPIIQNGKLVGAVTHVFVNDTTSGYGCYMEWMLRDAGIMLRSNTQELKAG